MTMQKSRKEYDHITSIPLGVRLSEAPLPKTISQLEVCLWKTTGECKEAMPDMYVKCNGNCFAYVATSIDKDKGLKDNSPLEYQI